MKTLMHIPAPLHKGRLLRRYKRFFADIELETGETVTAHCPNPGSMLAVAVEGSPVWASYNDDPKRKLRYTWQLAELGGALVGINTMYPNKIAEEAIGAEAVHELNGYPELRREVRYGEENSRIDLLLEREGAPPCYVEVKNVHLKRQDELAEFPDSVTSRGAKHLRELQGVLREGGRAVMLFVVQRPDCETFAVAGDIDPAYAEALRGAKASGVELLCYDCDIRLEGDGANISLRRALPIVDL